MSNRLQAYKQQVIEDELTREERRQEEAAKAREEEGSFSSIPSNLSISLEVAAAEEEEEIPLTPLMKKWKKGSLEVTSAPTPAPEQSSGKTKAKKGSFKEYAIKVVERIDQPQVFKRCTTTQELIDRYKQKASEAKEARLAEAEKKRLEEKKVAQQRAKDLKIPKKRIQELSEELGPQSKQKKKKNNSKKKNKCLLKTAPMNISSMR